METTNLKFMKPFHTSLIEISDSAKESLLNTIKKCGDSIQLTPDQAQECNFYSDCNGAVQYTVAKLYDDGELVCVEEGETWTDDDVITDDSSECDIEISAIMGVGEMDLYSLCKLSDFINATYGGGATEYAAQYKTVYDAAKSIFNRISFPHDISDNDFTDVQYIDEECNVVADSPKVLFQHYMLVKSWEKVSYEDIPMDDFALFVDELIKKEIVK